MEVHVDDDIYQLIMNPDGTPLRKGDNAVFSTYLVCLFCVINSGCECDCIVCKNTKACFSCSNYTSYDPEHIAIWYSWW